MTESIYKEYENKYYNPNDNDKKPGDNDNWKSIQKGFHDIGSTQLETSKGLTLGKGTEDETSVTAAELAAMKSGSAKYVTVETGSVSGITVNTTPTIVTMSDLTAYGDDLVPDKRYKMVAITVPQSYGGNIVVIPMVTTQTLTATEYHRVAFSVTALVMGNTSTAVGGSFRAILEEIINV